VSGHQSPPRSGGERRQPSSLGFFTYSIDSRSVPGASWRGALPVYVDAKCGEMRRPERAGKTAVGTQIKRPSGARKAAWSD
jgi:hypothetical protein